MTMPSILPRHHGETFDFFFFGTLMVPQILTRVLGHKGETLAFQDAILPDYVRHCVKGADYPGILPVQSSTRLLGRELTEEESSVRGTFVQGLSLADVRALDVFEGDEYRRDSLPVFTLTPPASLSTLAVDFTAPSTRQYVSPTTAREKAEKGEPGFQVVKGWCYCWKDDSDRGLSALENRVWDFQAFLREKSHRWTGLPPVSSAIQITRRDESEFAEVDQHRARGGRSFPDEGVAAVVG